MKKLLLSCSVLAFLSAPAQTLIRYGKDSVTVAEFLRAYQKNNSGTQNKKALAEYLDLYINSRLKIAEARARGYDTLAQIQQDLEGLRQQILSAYLTDKESLNKMTDEAFARSQKDIRLSHIFISFRSGFDTADARRKADAALQALKSGTPFSKVAEQYSDDPAAKSNGGDLGYITAFSLPYELENLAYATAPGTVSPLYRSKAGFHLFRNEGERKAIGRMKAAQILVAYPPNASADEKQRARKLADSLYNRLLKGDAFGKLAAAFSNDLVSAANAGQMPEFGTGQYETAFESAVFALPKDGAISKPFLTSHGYHIVKRISQEPVATVRTAKAMEAIRSLVEQSDRVSYIRSALAQKILKQVGYRRLLEEESQLWAYSDSVLNNQAPRRPLNLSGTSPLFAIRDSRYTVADWVSFAQMFRFKSDGSGIKPYSVLWNEFLEASALNYYQAHLEEFNEDFRSQLNEFRDGNLFFEIMQRQVWGPAQSDTIALTGFYKKDPSRYTWKAGADAVIFYASDAASARSFAAELRKNPKAWRKLAEERSEKIASDSSRFELAQIPNPGGQPLKAGMITGIQVNATDGSSSFAYIFRLRPQGDPRSFEEARGLVVTDYQDELEKAWLQELKKKYPVEVNRAAWDAVVRGRNGQ